MPEDSEKLGNSEQYDNPEWNKLKEGPSFMAIQKGKEMGVPQEVVDSFAKEVIDKKKTEGDFAGAYRFMKNVGMGQVEDQQNLGIEGYIYLMEAGDFSSAVGLAKEVYGQESEEFKRAVEAKELQEKTGLKTEQEGEKEDLTVSISKDATFQDLFNAIDALEEGEVGKFGFESELHDNFDQDIVDDIMEFRSKNMDEANKVRVFDFFKKKGYGQREVSAFLHIKVKREKKK